MSFTWRGPQVVSKLERAQLRGINRTMQQAVEHAKGNHTWQNRTGTLEGSISIAEPAHLVRNGASGLWGSKDVRYALIHELGGMAGRGKKVRIPARPYLRPAADATYGGLAGNIKRAFARV